MSSQTVLDASALLAWLLDERGSDEVLRDLDSSLISAVNWSEVVQHALALGIDSDSLHADFKSTGLSVVTADAEQAEGAARLASATRDAGLSLADRFCLALAESQSATAVTADRTWASLDLPVRIRLIR